MEDTELLRKYADEQSEPAFTELVERHVDLVYSTAVRLVSDVDLARDVVQVVFTDLARHARNHSRITVVSGWLYRRTCFAALDLLRSDSSRRAREKEAMELQEINASGSSVWQTLAPHLDEAMGWLSQADQDAIVLRFIENRSLREVGDCLGLSEDTAQKRVSRALARLRSFYARRGITVSLALLGTTLASNALQPATPELVSAVTTASVTAAKSTNAVSTFALWARWLTYKPVWFGLSAALVVVPLCYQVLQSAGAPTGANLVKNPGFEESTLSWKDTKGILTATSKFAHSGKASALVSERSAHYAGPIQQLPLHAMTRGGRYRCSAWVRVMSGGAQPVQMTIRYDDDQGTHYLTGARGSAVVDRWSEVTGDFVLSPAGAVNFVDLFLEGPAPGVEFLIDDVSVLPWR